MRAFVTGGGGFIGRHLVRRLVASGVDVRAIARSDRSAAKLRDLGAEVVLGDVVDASALADAIRACDVAYHLAGDYRVGIDESDRPAMESSNVTATVRLLDAAGGRRRANRPHLHDQRLGDDAEARREIGYAPRDLESGLVETFGRS